MDILLLIVLFLAVLVVPQLLFARKQRAKQNQLREVQDSLAPGDRVVTAGGLHGVVSSTDESTVILEIADGVYSRWEKVAILNLVADNGAVLSPGVRDEPEAITENAEGSEEAQVNEAEHPENLTTDEVRDFGEDSHNEDFSGRDDLPGDEPRR